MNNVNMANTRVGAWIVNASKHLLGFDVTDPSLASFTNIITAGKCGSLLIKLSADENDELDAKKVRAHASVCGIHGFEFDAYMTVLKKYGCVDWDKAQKTCQVLAFSRVRVLETTSQIFFELSQGDLETALLNFLEYCLLRPRLETEVNEFLSIELSGSQIIQLKSLVKSFSILGVCEIPGKKGELYFNGYQFGNRAETIGKALAAMNQKDRDDLNRLLEIVNSTPGIPPENVDATQKIKRMAIGLGLIEISEVVSPGGKASFLTSPLLSLPTVGEQTEHLEDDIFHHTKILLASLRFGELRSSPNRGRIIDPKWIVNALLQRDKVGPCTAIGQDYVLLETEGVTRTVPATNKPGRQFYMEIRRREPAEMVSALLKSGSSRAVDTRSIPLDLPTGFTGPESGRARAARRTISSDPETLRQFLEAIRT